MIKLQIAYQSGDTEEYSFPSFEQAYSVFKKRLCVSVYEMYIKCGSHILAGYFQPMNRFSDYD